MAYWLMKSEPGVYGIDDLERNGVEMWEGCRSYQVRNTFRDAMSIGDMAFFYHSNADPNGIVGTMEIVSDAYPDPTQFDGTSRYYDPKSSSEAPRWLVRDVKFICKFTRIVSLAQLRSTAGLEEMAVCQKGQRISVLPVSSREWEIVMALAGGA